METDGADLLHEEWSPERIVGHLRLHHGDDPQIQTTHETICTTRWKAVPREPCKHPRTGRAIRKNKRRAMKGQWRSRIADARRIEELLRQNLPKGTNLPDVQPGRA